jgi:hypothetical protein
MALSGALLLDQPLVQRHPPQSELGHRDLAYRHFDSFTSEAEAEVTGVQLV